MNSRATLILMLLGLSAGCDRPNSRDELSWPDSSAIVDATIGKRLPAKYAGRGNNMGAFEFISVPVLNPSVRTDMQQVNLFTETESGLVSGYRGDRPMESEAACAAAAARIAKVLQVQFPNATGRSDPERQYASPDGKIEAGVTCATRDPIVTLTMVVSNPTIEDRMMTKARNENR